MFSFTKKQQVWDIFNIKIGGQPGCYPTVLFGGLFFKNGLDFQSAEKHLYNMFQLSKKTGNPAVPDFFIKEENYVEKIVGFIDRCLPEDQAFAVDMTDPEVKVKVLEELDKRDLLPRTIYNSIHIGVTDEEVDALKEFTPEAAIVVAFNPKDKSPDGKIEILENSAHLKEKGLLDIASDVGIDKIILDAAALAPGDYSGAAVSAIPVLKEEYGLPVGCAIHNVVEKSGWLRKNFESSFSCVDAASNINISLFGGDYAIFGSIENSERVFSVVSWEDILVSEYTENYFGVEPAGFHPRRKLL
ncbi:MAG: hypothetical protein V5A64_04870 [Candidatus Thermoplasmatota archaeon]